MREETLKSLMDYINDKKNDYIGTLAKWYRESKWYKEPTLREVFGEEISGAVKDMLDTLNAKEDITRFVDVFESLAVSYGASWYDEDLGIVREGYEFETQVSTDLRNIAAKAINKPLADWQTFYQGYTG